MRVRILRRPDPTSSTVLLEVQRWCASQWEHVMNFEFSASEQANEFAMKLSMSKREPVEMAAFEDGQKVQADLSRPVFISGAVSGEEASEKNP